MTDRQYYVLIVFTVAQEELGIPWTILKGLTKINKNFSTIKDVLTLAQTEPQGFPVVTQHKSIFSSPFVHAAELPRCHQRIVIKGCPALQRSRLINSPTVSLLGSLMRSISVSLLRGPVLSPTLITEMSGVRIITCAGRGGKASYHANGCLFT